jgi:hypothetical protein
MRKYKITFVISLVLWLVSLFFLNTIIHNATITLVIFALLSIIILMTLGAFVYDLIAKIISTWKRK